MAVKLWSQLGSYCLFVPNVIYLWYMGETRQDLPMAGYTYVI